MYIQRQLEFGCVHKLDLLSCLALTSAAAGVDDCDGGGPPHVPESVSTLSKRPYGEEMNTVLFSVMHVASS
ncbi:CFC_HP_G0057210.mRNA.1.CDS.1 [Saccharomyces cerevisiae]|nr:CFC_HP_G0057210.mRNA.1.CDS.1 [Saccharomyces cerevisiae]CAI6540580.1 CFC_HP_G0057210.mRNA.1.CDS.1 [Saccharomyces cerevisiae]